MPDFTHQEGNPEATPLEVLKSRFDLRTEIEIYGGSCSWRDGAMVWSFAVTNGPKFSGIIDKKPGNSPLLATYHSMINALNWCHSNGHTDVTFICHDHTLVNQMNRIWNIRKDQPYYKLAGYVFAAINSGAFTIYFRREDKAYFEDSAARDLAHTTLDEFRTKVQK